MKKRTKQLYHLPTHKIRSKKVSKTSLTNCTGGGIVVAHEKENIVHPFTDITQSSDPSRLLLSSPKPIDVRLPDKIDLPKLAFDQLSSCSSNNSPRNFILSPRSQKSLFTSPLVTGKHIIIHRVKNCEYYNATSP